MTPQFVQPTFEDPVDRLQREGEIPANIDPGNPQIDDPVERARLMRMFERRLGAPAGYVLPVQRWNAKANPGWLSEIWRTRRGRLYLTPGDSPMGLRLPLSTLPHVKAPSYPFILPADPMIPRAALPELRVSPATFAHQDLAPSASPGPRFNSGSMQQGNAGPQTTSFGPPSVPDMPVRTALTIEERDGRLCVFMPPTEELEDYLELLAVVEATAEELGLPVQIEGYVPPPDPRLNVIKVTPDPGVIEVNIHPATSWRAAVDITRGVYEDAQQTRLGTDKFMIDGRHTGTGGGNHIVLGGASAARQPVPAPARSAQEPGAVLAAAAVAVLPVLRPVHRADQPGAAHRRGAAGPALRTGDRALRRAAARRGRGAAALAGRPAVPQSPGRRHRQHPSRRDLHRQAVLAGRTDRPARAGRIPLVRDAAGRADESGAATAAAGAGGVVLARAARRQAGALGHGAARPVHAGAFRLAGFSGGARRSRAARVIRFDPLWFAAQREFRFPLYGAVEHGGVRLEIRHALEPWYVLGEEGTVGGTVRFVDSSIERLQVKVEGLSPSRHIVTCNGRRLPLVSTGRPGEFVAGVRFKAWKLPSSLHPNVDVHAPLTFDVIDSWSRRSLGGCVYHASHPGGRNYETFPVNSYEAEARRRTRFEDLGHTPGLIAQLPPEERSVEYPTTLDLRRAVEPQ